MKINPVLAIFLFILIGSCDSSKEQSSDVLEQDEAILVSAVGSNATNPFLTKNHLGHPALCWTEELLDGGGYVVKYAVFDPVEEGFGDIITVGRAESLSFLELSKPGRAWMLD